MKYTKKPVEIDAVEWTGENYREMFEFLFDGNSPNTEFMCAEGKNFYISHGKYGRTILTIKTLEGEHIASIGDMIIKGVAGEFYPCKPDIFSRTYDQSKLKAS